MPYMYTCIFWSAQMGAITQEAHGILSEGCGSINMAWALITRLNGFR